MGKRFTRKILVLGSALLFLMLFFSPLLSITHPVGSVEIDTVGNLSELRKGIDANNEFQVEVWVLLAQNYELLNPEVSDYNVTVKIDMNLTKAPIATYIISATSQFLITEIEGNLPERAFYTYSYWGSPPVATVDVYLPGNASYFSMELKGRITGTSVLWRNTAEIFYFEVESKQAELFPFYTLVLVPPSDSKVLKVHSFSYPSLHYREDYFTGQKLIRVLDSHPNSPVVVLYQHETWEIYALAFMLLTVFSIIALPFIIKARRVVTFLAKLASKLQSTLPRLRSLIIEIYHKALSIDSSKFLTVYVLCALLMISTSLVMGPEPRLKVYVFTSTPERAEAIGDFIYKEGAVAVTTYDVKAELKTLTDLGVFSAVIIGDFYPPGESILNLYVYPALDSVPQIIIIREFTLSEVFSTEIRRRYSDKSRSVAQLSDLGPVLNDLPRRTNVLELNLSSQAFKIASVFVGLSSFLLVFLGLAFLASKLIEVGKKPGLGGVPEAITYSIFIFIFNQMVYIICTVLLAVPVGLHAGSPKVTAIGPLGFGGGSRPRLFAGIAGFLFGSISSLNKGLKLDKVGFISFLIGGFFVLLDPLTNGVIFYEFVLLFTVGPGLEHAYSTWSYVRGFLGNIGIYFGAWLSPAYELSTGVMFYYAGAIPFCLLSKLKKSTATILLLFSAFVVSDGGIRVADMRPWKAFASIIPGIMTGLLFVVVFSVLSLAEHIIREKIGSRPA